MQVADIALVKYLLANSRTLEVHQKTAQGQTFLEHVVAQIGNVCFLPYASCMDELLACRVPITLPAMAGLWEHIGAECEKLRWTIDEEYQLMLSRDRQHSLRRSRGVPDDMDYVVPNAGRAPRPLAAMPLSLMSTGSLVRVSAGASPPVLAPVAEDEPETSSMLPSGWPARFGEDGKGGGGLAGLEEEVGESSFDLSGLVGREVGERWAAARELHDEDRYAALELDNGLGTSPPSPLVPDLWASDQGRADGQPLPGRGGGTHSDVAGLADEMPLQAGSTGGADTRRTGGGKSRSMGSAAVESVLARRVQDETAMHVSAQSFGAAHVGSVHDGTFFHLHQQLALLC
jgi:hypothetical protein